MTSQHELPIELIEALERMVEANQRLVTAKRKGTPHEVTLAEKDMDDARKIFDARYGETVELD